MIDVDVEPGDKAAAEFLAWFVAFGVLAATLPAAEMTPWFYLLGAVIGASVELFTR